MGDEMIERELIEDIESRLGMAAHNLGTCSINMRIRPVNQSEIDMVRTDIEKAFKSWLTLRTKLQAAGVVSNMGGEQ